MDYDQIKWYDRVIQGGEPIKYRAALLLKQHLIDYCKNNIPDFTDRFQLDYYDYDTLEELEHLYHSLKDSYDGFISSGIVPHHFLTEIGRNDDVSFGCFRFDIENTYRILLQQCISRGSADLSRVGIDFLGPDASLAQVISDGNLPRAASGFEWRVSMLSAEALVAFEDALNKRYLDRYQRGELDFIVTYFYSTVQTFKDLPLDCYYLYPSENEFRYVMRSLEQNIVQRKAQGSFPAVIRIDFTEDIKENLQKADLYTAEMQRILLNLIDHFNNKLSLKSGTGYFELYTDSRTVDQMTDRFHSCALIHHLQKNTHFNGTIGYGIGSDFYSARANAMRAERFGSQQLDKKSGSYLIDQSQMLTCLADSDQLEEKWMTNIPADYVTQIADRAGLPAHAIRKIIGILSHGSTNQLSSTDLISYLGISLRTANRYLASLEKCGIAKAVGRRNVNGRGRPIVIYELDLRPLNT